MNNLSHHARQIFSEALRRIDVEQVVAAQVRCDGATLALGRRFTPLSEVDNLLILAVGKAAVPMHRAACHAITKASPLPIASVVVAPEPPADLPHGTLFFPGAHPIPDLRSLTAASAILDLLETTNARTAVLFLVSGGASAMIELPLDSAISLPDVAAFHRALIGSGLPITQMNALRKHFSAVKGGRLAQAAAVARMQCTLLISDVPAASLDTIGSGPSLPDTTTIAECRPLLSRLAMSAPLPATVTRFFSGSLCVETPKPGDPAFDRAHWSLVFSSDHLAEAAAAAARALGFHVEIDNTCDEWEYRDAARYLLDRSHSLSLQHRRSCLVSVGELSVQLPPSPGHGGRNQQFALWCAQELVRRNTPATILSAGSDGIDGASSAAGAVCDETTPARAAHLGFSAEAALAAFNTAPLLAAIKADVTTGPTGNNLRDLRLLLTASE